LQDFVKAVDYFSQAVQMAPEYSEAWYNRAYCYELLGQDELARNDYQQTLKLKSNYQKAIEGLNRLDSN
jgi:Flp pilus assembly protein TadD